MTIRYTPRAARHLADILEFVSRDDPRAARRVIRRIRVSIRRLDLFPSSGRPGVLAGTLELVVPGLPFIVVYRMSGNEVEILGVFHAARVKCD